MDRVEELLVKRRWCKDCLRLNIAQEGQVITRGRSGNFKVALIQSNVLRKNEHELREAIQAIAPEWWGDETQVLVNKNVQCRRHKDRNKEHSWILWLGDYTGGELHFDNGLTLDEKYKWHKIDGQIPHWNEPHTGDKYAIVLYRNGAKKTKIQNILETVRKRREEEVDKLAEKAMDLLQAETLNLNQHIN